MKKITKEQRTHIINKMSSGLLTDNSNPFLYTQGHIIEALNECTENEFPHIRLEADLGSVEVLQTSGNEISLGMSWSNVSSAIALLPLNFEQFKEFTAGCNKIVEWIKEKE